MKKAGFDVNFIPSTSDKQCDILVNSFKMEVKTFLDSNDPILEGSLRNEILQTLKRDKAVIDIKDALSKKSGIVLIFLSFTSLGLGFLKYTYNRDVNFSLQKALTEAFHLAQHDRTVENVRYVEKIPVVTFTTAIDIPNLAYKMFFYTVPYPVKKVNDNFEPDKDKLKIDLNI
jgi:hypothetical protein